jgi:hypothetical protein
MIKYLKGFLFVNCSIYFEKSIYLKNILILHYFLSVQYFSDFVLNLNSCQAC